MELSARCNYQKLLSHLKVSCPEELPAVTKCPICGTNHSLQVERTNTTGTAYFCNSCHFLGDSIQLFSKAHKTDNLEATLMEMLSIPGLLQGNPVDVRASAAEYLQGLGKLRQERTDTIAKGWARLSHDPKDAQDILWEYGLWGASDKGAHLVPNLCALTINELVDVFDINEQGVRRFKNKSKCQLCIPVFKDLLTINGFLIIKENKNIVEVSKVGLEKEETLGVPFYLSRHPKARRTLIFDDILDICKFQYRCSTTFCSVSTLLTTGSTAVADLVDSVVGRSVILHGDLDSAVKLGCELPNSRVMVTQDYTRTDMESLAPLDFAKSIEQEAQPAHRLVLQYILESTPLAAASFVSQLRLSKDLIQQIINEAPIVDKLKVEEALVEAPTQQEIQVYDKKIVYKEGVWYHHGVLVTDAPFVIDSVVRLEDGNSIVTGEIQYKGTKFPFSSPLNQVFKKTADWLQDTMISAGAGLPQINRKYARMLYDIAISYQAPAVRNAGKPIGWEVTGDTYSMPQFDISGAGYSPHEVGVHPENIGVKVPVPEALADFEIDDLLSPTSASQVFWNIIGVQLYNISARLYGGEQLSLCFVSDDYKNFSLEAGRCRVAFGTPTFDFSKTRKTHLKRLDLLAGHNPIGCAFGYDDCFRMPGFLHWIKQTSLPVITAAPRIDFLNFSNNDATWLYLKCDTTSSSRHTDYYRYLWLRVQELLAEGRFPDYTVTTPKQALSKIISDCVSCLAKQRQAPAPALDVLVPTTAEESEYNDLDRMIATTLKWVSEGGLSFKLYDEAKKPDKEDSNKVIYDQVQYYFPRDAVLPLYLREGFIAPSSAVIERQLKIRSNSGGITSFKLHGQHWWCIPFAEVAYNNE